MKSNNNGNGSSSSSSSSNGSCASCRHQRKKCGRNCVLAPHFPASKKADFDLVLKHFGVKNLVQRMKEEPDMEARKNIIRSMVWDAKAREDDPEFGSYGLNQALLKRVEMLETYVMRGTYRWCNNLNLQMHPNNNFRADQYHQSMSVKPTLFSNGSWNYHHSRLGGSHTERRRTEFNVNGNNGILKHE